MSRREEQIRAVAAECGIEVAELTWEPIGMAMEMCGPSGGWRLVDAEGDDYMAYNSEDLIARLRESKEG